MFNKMRRVILTLLIVSGMFLIAWGGFRYMRHIDTDKILAKSVLKNRQFASKVKEIKKDGWSAYLLEEHSNPIVSISFMFRNSGRAHEQEGKFGIVPLLTDVIQKGAGAYDAEKFIDLCSEYGVHIDFTASLDSISGKLEFPKKHQDIALKLFRAALTEPHFDKKYVDLSKEQLVVALNLRHEQLHAFGADKFREIIFAGHPYERPAIGKAEDIMSITKEDLKNYMLRHFARDNLQIGIAGDVSEDEATEVLQEAFGLLPAHAQTQELEKIKTDIAGKTYFEKFDAAQVYVVFAVPGVYRSDKDFYPLYLANYIFGSSGLEARLNKSIREEEGLTYGLYTYMSMNDASALIEGIFSSTPNNLPRAKELLLEEWQKMAQNGVTEAELQQAKESLTASENLRYASIVGISGMLLAMQHYHLGRDFLEKRNDYINNTTLQEVNAAARKYFDVMPDFVIVGSQSEEKN